MRFIKCVFFVIYTFVFYIFVLISIILGTWSSNASSSCLPCPNGFTCDDPSNPVSCPSGTYWNNAGNVSVLHTNRGFASALLFLRRVAPRGITEESFELIRSVIYVALLVQMATFRTNSEEKSLDLRPCIFLVLHGSFFADWWTDFEDLSTVFKCTLP